MSKIKSFIVVEDRLAEMFDLLPDIKGFKTRFGFGDIKELNAFLRNRDKLPTKNIYPLIWLLYPYKEEHNTRSVNISNLELIVAVQTNSSMENSQRIEETYKEVLFPLLDNINSLFLKANIVNMGEEYEVTKYPNYSSSDSGEEHGGTFIWDAMKLTYDMRLTDDCLKNIIFK